MARDLETDLLKQGLCWLSLRQVSVFSKNKDISNTNIGNNKNGFIIQLEFGNYIRDPTWRFLRPFLFLLCQRLLCPGKQSNQNWAKEREAIRNFVSLSCVFRQCFINLLPGLHYFHPKRANWFLQLPDLKLIWKRTADYISPKRRTRDWAKLYISARKGIQDSLGFQIPVTAFQSL